MNPSEINILRNQRMVRGVPITFSIFYLFLQISSSYSSSLPDGFLHCLSTEFPSNISTLSVLYEASNSSYQFVLSSTSQNLRFQTPTTPKPVAIITPVRYSHVQAAVVCCKRQRLQIRIRSGGHDYEGLSFRSDVPFIIVDLQNLRSIEIGIGDYSAWVESGATIGELHYWIAQKSLVHGFPAGLYPTVGIGGHISGGGLGNLFRKYGLAADNVIDAYIVDTEGRILDRKSMGSELFWAIKGGGGASFGVIVAWKIKLVPVPPVVTIFNLAKSLEEGAIQLLHKWQYIGHKLSEDLLISVFISRDSSNSSKAVVKVTFSSVFLGTVENLLKIMEKSFPELGLVKEDCSEMSWIESVLSFAGYQNPETIDALKNRVPVQPKNYWKGKSDMIQEPLPLVALEELWKWCLEEEIFSILMYPFGGKMSRISESETPFPFRQGVLYSILYTVSWEAENASERHINWIRGLYQSMAPYLPEHCPRGAYLNSRDLDLGVNDISAGTSTYSKAKVWGYQYFRNNFKRLAIVKGDFDPDDFLFYEQSIPPFARK